MRVMGPGARGQGRGGALHNWGSVTQSRAHTRTEHQPGASRTAWRHWEPRDWGRCQDRGIAAPRTLHGPRAHSRTDTHGAAPHGSAAAHQQP